MCNCPHLCRKEWKNNVPNVEGTQYKGQINTGSCWSKTVFIPSSFPLPYLCFCYRFHLKYPSSHPEGSKAFPLAKAFFNYQMIHETSPDTQEQHWASSTGPPYIQILPDRAEYHCMHTCIYSTHIYPAFLCTGNHPWPGDKVSNIKTTSYANKCYRKKRI